MRVLITGAGGQIGREVAARFGDRGDVVACDRAALDIGDRDQVLGAVGSLRPDVVINCGAYTAVDACETDTARAYRDNAIAVRYIAEAADRFGAHVCHISTDYVFDGTKAAPYDEWDRPNPQSVYGRSKWAGEQELGPSATIVRTSWVCGEHGANMVKTILRLAAQPGALRFVDDQRGNPSFADDLSVAIHRLAIDRRRGIYHVTNQGAVSWYEFAREVLTAAGHDPARVEPISTAELQPPRPAARPANSVLDNAALRLDGLPLLADFREPLHRLVARLL